MRCYISAACVLLVSALACTARDDTSRASAITPGRTNVLLVIIDTLRADHLSAWGYPADTSPHIARLAAQSVQFTRTFANSSWTRPSIASLTTGRYPRETGIYEAYNDTLAPDLVTLAERFRQRGYLTLGITANTNINSSFGFDQGFEIYGDAADVWDWIPKAPSAAKMKSQIHDAAWLNERALALVDRFDTRLQEGPFFLQLLYMDPHVPYRVHAKHRVNSRYPLYDSEIRYVDHHLGTLLDELDRRGLLDDTLVIVTSDHGEGLDSQSGLPKSETHGFTLYDSVLHVPLLFWHRALPAEKIDELSELIDIVPTLVDLLELPPESLPGRALLAPHAAKRTPAIFSETDFRETQKVSLRTAEYRFVRNVDAQLLQEDIYEGGLREELIRSFELTGPEELYRRDRPRPENPLRDNLLHTDVRRAKELRAQLDAWLGAVDARPPLNRSPKDVIHERGVVRQVSPDAPAAEVSGAEREQLRALGYTEAQDTSGARE